MICACPISVQTSATPLFAMAAQCLDLLKRYRLSERDVGVEVSEAHLKEIAHFDLREWKPLFSQLECAVSEAEFRTEEVQSFFSAWKRDKGSGATYKKLIVAFLKTESRESAEGVCKLLHSVMPSKSKETTSAGDESKLEIWGRVYRPIAKLHSSVKTVAILDGKIF